MKGFIFPLQLLQEAPERLSKWQQLNHLKTQSKASPPLLKQISVPAHIWDQKLLFPAGKVTIQWRDLSVLGFQLLLVSWSVLSFLGGQFSLNSIQLWKPLLLVKCSGTDPHTSRPLYLSRKATFICFSEASKTHRLPQPEGARGDKPTLSLFWKPSAEVLHIPHAHKTISFQGVSRLQIDSLLELLLISTCIGARLYWIDPSEVALPDSK